MRSRVLKTITLMLAAIAPVLSAQTPSPSPNSVITINTQDSGTPFPHFWEQIFGSGRAILSLRQSYRDDLNTVKGVTDFDAVRFHGIFMDDVGLYDPNATTQNPGQAAQKAQPGQSPYNFSYVDQIYDGLLANHIRPFVELSFMPRKMASDPAALHAFWYKPNVSPPKDYALWDAMITAFTQHLIDRYGIEEVSKWRFEVWNEPNLDFWMGNPKQPTYFELYDHTALAIKKVSKRLLIGGPSTAQAAWVAAFLDHCKQNNIPSTLRAPTSTPTTPRKTSSALRNKFRATRWSAAPFAKCTRRSSRLHFQTHRSSSANTTPATPMSLTSQTASTWGRGSQAPSASATASPRP